MISQLICFIDAFKAGTLNLVIDHKNGKATQNKSYVLPQKTHKIVFFLLFCEFILLGLK